MVNNEEFIGGTEYLTL